MSVTVCLLALLVAVPQRGPARPDPREQLTTAIAEGIRLLEAKEYKAFVMTFVPAEELKKRGDIDAFVEKFAGPRASQLLAALKEIQTATPVMDESGTKATFALQAAGGRPNSLRFERIGGYWYIAN
jgi:hypothetical protein